MIRNAEWLAGEPCVDVRCRDARIVEVGQGLQAAIDEHSIDAAGAALVPGLHDHHLHLGALAAAKASVVCGPPQLESEAELIAALQKHATENAAGWLRGVAYHESVAGEIDRDWLDRVMPDRPLRIQHRSGRLWLLNSAALAAIGATEGSAPARAVPDRFDDFAKPSAVGDSGTHDLQAGRLPLERQAGRYTGRLYDADGWLRSRLQTQRPDLGDCSRRLAARGVVGVTDTSHDNDAAARDWFAAAQADGRLLQRVLMMGDASLDAVFISGHGAASLSSGPSAEGIASASDPAMLAIGAHKFHLHDHDLPPFDALCAAIAASHRVQRNVAFHCVSRGELVYALAVLREVGARAGDRIEHAGITPPEALQEIADLGLTVVTQPNFIAERGDAYLRDVDAADRPWLYRLASFDRGGIALAGSTDAPYGGADPWAAMQAAVTRRTLAGAVIGVEEALTPERALALFCGDGATPSQPRRLAVGGRADLCLLDRNWQSARADLAAVQVRLCLRDGVPIHAETSVPGLSNATAP